MTPISEDMSTSSRVCALTQYTRSGDLPSLRIWIGRLVLRWPAAAAPSALSTTANSSGGRHSNEPRNRGIIETAVAVRVGAASKSHTGRVEGWVMLAVRFFAVHGQSSHDPRNKPIDGPIRYSLVTNGKMMSVTAIDKTISFKIEYRNRCRVSSTVTYVLHLINLQLTVTMGLLYIETK
jgi:hypothetical protein